MKFTGRGLLVQIVMGLASTAMLLVDQAWGQDRSGTPQLIVVQGQNGRLVPPRHSVVWRPGQPDKELRPSFAAAIRPTSIVVGQGHPNPTKVLATFDRLPGERYGRAVLLPLNLSLGLNSFGNLEDPFFLEVAAHDFDGDGIPELIVAIADPALYLLEFNIIKYHPPQSAGDRDRPENWSVLLSESGSQQVILSGADVDAPIGIRRFSNNYTLIRGKFVKTSP